jgi:paraquat-inducible protein B
MADEPDLNNLPKATVVRKRRTRVSIVWIIPILAVLVALGIAVQRVVSEGPVVTIVFKLAPGVEAGKTFITYKDVRIGQVIAVQLSEDYSKVVVKARIAKHAAGLMVKDAQFWVVEPRISLSGVSGLSTLLSGNYIGFRAGKSEEEERNFTGLDEPPPITDQAGRKFVLRAETMGSLGVGAPVYYRQLNVGQVAEYALAPDGKSVAVTIFVNAPYDKFVTPDTRFWNASGLDISVGANGVDVHTESLTALIAGGLAFDAPEAPTPLPPAAANSVFTLYADRTVAMKQPDLSERKFVLYFDESVRGLSVGAPVTMYGLPVGEVAEVGLSIDPATQSIRPRVLITFSPDRFVKRMSADTRAQGKAELEPGSPAARLSNLRRQVEERGLRAQLQTGSLLTGELYVDFAYVPNAPKVKIDWGREPQQLPVVPGGLANLENKLSSILTKVDNMPLDAIGREVKNSLSALSQTLKDADGMLTRIDTQVVPEASRTLQDARHAIAAADRAISDADSTLLSGDSPATQDLRDTLQEVTRAARSVRVLVDYLERHPEILIRGKTEEKK